MSVSGLEHLPSSASLGLDNKAYTLETNIQHDLWHRRVGRCSGKFQALATSVLATSIPHYNFRFHGFSIYGRT